MKQSKEFFDELDQDWDSVLSNTYKDSNKLTYYDKTIDKGGIINRSSVDISSFKNTYEERYVTVDGKYIIILSLMIGTAVSAGKKNISFSMDLKELETNVTISYINSLMVYNELLFISKDDNQETYIDTKFVIDFIKMGVDSLNQFEQQKKIPIKQETIDKTIEHIKSHTKES